MDIAFWIYVLTFIATVISLYRYFAYDRIRISKEIDKIPGPLALPLVGTAYRIFVLKREEIFSVIDSITRIHWPIFRTWTSFHGEVHLCDADDVETVFSSSVNISKGQLYKFLMPWLGTGLLTNTGQKWHKNRKLLTPAFHFKILENFIDIFGENSEILVRQLQKEVGNRDGFNLYPYITLCALDIICETAMGTRVNAQEHSESAYVRAVYELSELVIYRFTKPWLHNDFLFSMSDAGKRFKRGIEILHGFTNKVIKERKEVLESRREEKDHPMDEFGRKKRQAFLDLLLEVSKGGTVLSDKEIQQEVDTFMFEGHDTTSASMCWTLYLLGLHSDIQEKVYREQEEIFQGSERKATLTDLAEMKYMERVLKESLRLYPSVPIITRQVTESFKAGEYTIPAGTQAMVHIYHVHRDPKHYPNPEKFDPDNFLPERVRGRHPFAYVPFSAGSRNCIGQKFALLEEKSVLSAVIRHYRIQSLDQPSDIAITGELVLRPATGIRMNIERR